MIQLRASMLIILTAVAACQKSEPKITGAEATRVLERCIMADALLSIDMQERQASDTDFTPQMVAHIDEAIAACKLVGQIDQSALAVDVRPCVNVYALKSEVYEAAKPVLIDRQATARELERLNEAFENLATQERACKNPGPTTVV